MKLDRSPLIILLVGALCGAILRDYFQLPEAVADREPVQLPGEYQAPFNPQEAINVAVYEQTNRGVVNIATKATRPSVFRDVAYSGSGSGSVIDSDGHILTNFHVIEDAQQISVTLYNGSNFTARLVGVDADNDIAVLRIDAPASLLHPISFGDSSELAVGQHIIAIGNPFGLERTMSDGIISATNRQINSKTGRLIKSIIQIDAALNQGNSGGPLLDSNGRLIGMNTAIATSTGDNAGIGFAIPINTIARVVPQLILNGRVIRPTIGITKVLEVEDGLLIVEITPGGPAAQAGLKEAIVERHSRQGFVDIVRRELDMTRADLIVGVDGEAIESSEDLIAAIESRKAGDRIVLRIIRDNVPQDVAVTLGSE